MAGKVREKAKGDGPFGPSLFVKTVILEFLHRTLPSTKIRKESDLYRPLAIPVIWRRYRPPNSEYAL